jgi:hypothetical protein
MRRPVPGLLLKVRDQLDHDAVARWRVPAWVAEFLFVLPLLLSVVLAASVVYPSLYFRLLNEDGLVEWLQFVCFSLASILGFLVATHYWKEGDRSASAFFLVFAVGCLFLAGEEISWGQRVFDFGTPSALEEVNMQGEANVHNVGLVRVGLKFVAIAVGLGGFLVPWLAGVRRRLPEFLIPPFFLASAFLVIFLYNFGRLVYEPEGFFRGGENVNVKFSRFGEWPELCVAYILVAFTFLTWRRKARWTSGSEAEMTGASARDRD